QLRATVGDTSRSFPGPCGDLPPSAANPAALDAGCLQAAINPLAVLNMRWVPLTILYEPPGNCSWSNLGQEHTAGTKVAAIASSSTSTHTISDTGFFWDVEHSDYTTDQTSGSSRSTEVRVTRGDAVGTRFGLPRSNPGNPKCNVPGSTVP